MNVVLNVVQLIISVSQYLIEYFVVVFRPAIAKLRHFVINLSKCLYISFLEESDAAYTSDEEEKKDDKKSSSDEEKKKNEYTSDEEEKKDEEKKVRFRV